MKTLPFFAEKNVSFALLIDIVFQQKNICTLDFICTIRLHKTLGKDFVKYLYSVYVYSVYLKYDLLCFMRLG